MKNTIIWIVAAAVILGGIWLYQTKNGDQVGTLENGDQKTLNIGALLPFSGPAAFYGDQARMGVELAKEEMAATYPNLNIVVSYEDSFFTPKGGVDGYNKLKNTSGLDAVITGGSPVSMAVAALSKQDDLLQMGIFSATDLYTSPDDLTFRVTTRVSVDLENTIAFYLEKKFSRLAIVYLNNDFGASFRNSLKQKIDQDKLPISVVADEGFLLDASDFRTILLKVKQSNPDVIFIAGTTPHNAKLLVQAKELGIKTQITSVRTIEDPNLFKTAGNAADGVIFTAIFDADSDHQPTKDFIKSFFERYNTTPDTYAAEGYEGMKLTARALAKCTSVDAECLKEVMADLSDHSPMFKDFHFDQNGDPLYALFLKTIKNGQFVKLEN
ncbi:MAG: ABC transporter substrate-binding protein [Patescibacteria group bacterium]